MDKRGKKGVEKENSPAASLGVRGGTKKFHVVRRRSSVRYR